MPDKISAGKIYSALKFGGYKVGKTYDEFLKNAAKGEANRQWMYEKAKKSGLAVDDYDSFSKALVPPGFGSWEMYDKANTSSSAPKSQSQQPAAEQSKPSSQPTAKTQTSAKEQTQPTAKKTTSQPAAQPAAKPAAQQTSTQTAQSGGSFTDLINSIKQNYNTAIEKGKSNAPVPEYDPNMFSNTTPLTEEEKQKAQADYVLKYGIGGGLGLEGQGEKGVMARVTGNARSTIEESKKKVDRLSEHKKAKPLNAERTGVESADMELLTPEQRTAKEQVKAMESYSHQQNLQYEAKIKEIQDTYSKELGGVIEGIVQNNWDSSESQQGLEKVKNVVRNFAGYDFQQALGQGMLLSYNSDDVSTTNVMRDIRKYLYSEDFKNKATKAANEVGLSVRDFYKYIVMPTVSDAASQKMISLRTPKGVNEYMVRKAYSESILGMLSSSLSMNKDDRELEQYAKEKFANSNPASKYLNGVSFVYEIADDAILYYFTEGIGSAMGEAVAKPAVSALVKQGLSKSVAKQMVARGLAGRGMAIASRAAAGAAQFQTFETISSLANQMYNNGNVDAYQTIMDSTKGSVLGSVMGLGGIGTDKLTRYLTEVGNNTAVKAGVAKEIGGNVGKFIGYGADLNMRTLTMSGINTLYEMANGKDVDFSENYINALRTNIAFDIIGKAKQLGAASESGFKVFFKTDVPPNIRFTQKDIDVLKANGIEGNDYYSMLLNLSKGWKDFTEAVNFQDEYLAREAEAKKAEQTLKNIIAEYKGTSAAPEKIMNQYREAIKVMEDWDAWNKNGGKDKNERAKKAIDHWSNNIIGGKGVTLETANKIMYVLTGSELGVPKTMRSSISSEDGKFIVTDEAAPGVVIRRNSFNTIDEAIQYRNNLDAKESVSHTISTAREILNQSHVGEVSQLCDAIVISTKGLFDRKLASDMVAAVMKSERGEVLNSNEALIVKSFHNVLSRNPEMRARYEGLSFNSIVTEIANKYGISPDFINRIIDKGIDPQEYLSKKGFDKRYAAIEELRDYLLDVLNFSSKFETYKDLNNDTKLIGESKVFEQSPDDAVRSDAADMNFEAGAQATREGQYAAGKSASELKASLEAKGAGEKCAELERLAQDYAGSKTISSEVREVLDEVTDEALRGELEDYFMSLVRVEGVKSAADNAINTARQQMTQNLEDCYAVKEGENGMPSTVREGTYRDPMRPGTEERVLMASIEPSSSDLVYIIRRGEDGSFTAAEAVSNKHVTFDEPITLDDYLDRELKPLNEQVTAGAVNNLTNHPNTKAPEVGLSVVDGTNQYVITEVRPDNSVVVAPAKFNPEKGEVEPIQGKTPEVWPSERIYQLQNDFYNAMDSETTTGEAAPTPTPVTPTTPTTPTGPSSSAAPTVKTGHKAGDITVDLTEKDGITTYTFSEYVQTRKGWIGRLSFGGVKISIEDLLLDPDSEFAENMSEYESIKILNIKTNGDRYFADLWADGIKIPHAELKPESAERIIDKYYNSKETPAAPTAETPSVTMQPNGLQIDNATGDPVITDTTPPKSVAEYYHGLSSQLSTPEIDALIDGKVEAAQNALDAANSVEAPKPNGMSVNDYLKAKEEYNNAKDNARKELEFWNGVKGELNGLRQAETTQMYENGEVPDVSMDTPAAIRERGFFMANGERIDVNTPHAPLLEGKPVTAVFANTPEGKIPGKVVFYNNRDVIASHENGQPVLEYAPASGRQPKNRNDLASLEALRNAQNNFNPALLFTDGSVYDGLTTITPDRYTVQGNFRKNLIDELIKKNGYEWFRNLLKEHADWLGVTPEQIDALPEGSVPYIQLEGISENDAIRLGNYGREDLETGGNQQFNPITASELIRSNGSEGKVLSILLNDPEGDTSLSGLIKLNGLDALREMNRIGAINTTQLQTSIADGKISDIARIQLEQLVSNLVLGKSTPKGKSGFESLPEKKQEGIIGVYSMDVNAEVGNRLMPDVLAALELIGYANPNNEFSKAKTKGDALKGINGLLKTLDSSASVPKFTPFQIELAARLKTESARSIMDDMKEYYDAVRKKELSLFDDEGASETLSKEDAVKQIFGVDYVQQTPQRDAGLGNNNRPSGTQPQPLQGGIGGSQQGTTGTGQAINTGSVESVGGGNKPTVEEQLRNPNAIMDLTKVPEVMAIKTLDDFKSLFDKMNGDKDLKKLFDIVFDTCKLIKFNEVQIVDSFKDSTVVAQWGLFDKSTNGVVHKLFLSEKGLRRPYTNQAKASGGLHEMIHGVTAIAYSIKNGVLSEEAVNTIPENVRKSLAEGIRKLDDLYNTIKNDELFNGLYGVHDKFGNTAADMHNDGGEIIAELANPEFREALKQKDLWVQTVDAVTTFFDQEVEGAEKSDALTETERILGDFIDTWNGRPMQPKTGEKLLTAEQIDSLYLPHNVKRGAKGWIENKANDPNFENEYLQIRYEQAVDAWNGTHPKTGKKPTLVFKDIKPTDIKVGQRYYANNGTKEWWYDIIGTSKSGKSFMVQYQTKGGSIETSVEPFRTIYDVLTSTGNGFYKVEEGAAQIPNSVKTDSDTSNSAINNVENSTKNENEKPKETKLNLPFTNGVHLYRNKLAGGNTIARVLTDGKTYTVQYYTGKDLLPTSERGGIMIGDKEMSPEEFKMHWDAGEFGEELDKEGNPISVGTTTNTEKPKTLEEKQAERMQRIKDLLKKIGELREQGADLRDRKVAPYDWEGQAEQIVDYRNAKTDLDKAAKIVKQELSDVIAEYGYGLIEAGETDEEHWTRSMKSLFADSLKKEFGWTDDVKVDRFINTIKNYVDVPNEKGEMRSISEHLAAAKANSAGNSLPNESNTVTSQINTDNNGESQGETSLPGVGTNASSTDGGLRTGRTEGIAEVGSAGTESNGNSGTNDGGMGEPTTAGQQPIRGERTAEGGTSEPVRTEQTDGVGGRGSSDTETIEGTTADGSRGGVSRPTTPRTPILKNQRNYVYPEDFEQTHTTPNQRLKANADAIRTLFKLIDENREATQEEKEILAGFTGWGALPVNGLNAYRASQSGNSFIRDIGNLILRYDHRDEKGIARAMGEASLTSYYTPMKLAESMGNFLQLAGFNGGSLLDPSMGMGVFEATLPEALRNNTALNGIELDWLTGQIATRLYPDANVRIRGFQDAGIAENSHDVVISNIPFGNIRVNDSVWNANQSPIRRAAEKAIHNYFAVKMIESTKPGGLTVIMTSNAIMDTKGNQSIREYIAEKTEILGSIRLPEETFNDAGTKVVTDVIFLRKYKNADDRQLTIDRPGYKDNVLNPFLSTHEQDVNGVTVKMNGYYGANPHMMIGTVKAGGQYSADQFGLAIGEERNLEEEFSSLIRDAIIGDRAGELFDTHVSERETKTAVRESYVGDGNYVSTDNLTIQNGKVGRLEVTKNKYGDTEITFIEEPKLAKFKERVTAMQPLRKAMKELIAEEINRASDERLAELRKTLQEEYNRYVALYGRLASKDNAYLKEDINGFALLNLEKWKDGKFQGLSDIFSKKTIKSELDLTNVKSPTDALAMSLSEYGELKPSFLEKVLGENWVEQCGESIFKVPNTDSYVTRDNYLSGDVKTKLAQAEEAFETDKSLERNVEALKNVIPSDIQFDDISIRMGARWVPLEYYNQFMTSVLGIRYRGLRNKGSVKSRIDYHTESDSYILNIDELEMGSEAKTWETSQMNAKKIFEAALLDKTVKIYFPHDKDERPVINREATDIANGKIEELREYFIDWLGKDANRMETLQQLYNDKFNRSVMRKWDGSHLNIPGLMGMQLRPHQNDAVWMILNNRGGIVDHMVGAGKTLVMQTAIMEMRRMGIAKKPMIIALKATVSQIAKEFAQAYPQARIIYPSENDFKEKNRKNLLAKMAQNDYDCVILSHEQYAALPHSEEMETAVTNEQINALESLIQYLYGHPSKDSLTKRQIKGLEKRLMNLRAKLDKLRENRKDYGFDFEGLGVDYLFVDECQAFKNLAYSTSYNNVAGLGPAEGSSRSLALLHGVRYLQKLHQGDKGTIFLSGTTITNSIVEAYTLMNYLRPGELQRLGMTTFDAWASNFAVRSMELEYGVTNELKEKNRFRSFANLPELSKMYAEIADVRNDNNLKLDKPKKNTSVVIVPQDEELEEINREIINMVKTKNGRYFGVFGDDKTPWSLLAASYSAKAAVSPKLIDDKYESRGKVPYVCENVAKVYHQFEKQKGAQIIFCDAVKGSGENKYSVYKDIINTLVNDYGIPKEQIADIHDYNNNDKRKELFAKVQDGSVRILLGGTKNLGTGVNVQNRLAAVHHLDVSWTPADMEQRNGRIIRQGNWLAKEFNNNEGLIFNYATEGSLDQYKYQLNDIKGKMFDDFKMGAVGDRNFDEGGADETGALDPAELVARLSGNSVVLDKSKQDKLVEKLRRMKRGYESDRQRSIIEKKNLEESKEKCERLVNLSDKDVAKVLASGTVKPKDNGSYDVPTGLTVNIDGYLHNFEKGGKDAGDTILNAVAAGKKVILTAHGVEAKVDENESRLFKYQIEVTNGSDIAYTEELSEDSTQAGLGMSRLVHKILNNNSIYKNWLKDINDRLSNLTINDEVWPREKELAEAIAKKAELDAEYRKLSADENDADSRSKKVYDKTNPYDIAEEALVDTRNAKIKNNFGNSLSGEEINLYLQNDNGQLDYGRLKELREGIRSGKIKLSGNRTEEVHGATSETHKFALAICGAIDEAIGKEPIGRKRTAQRQILQRIFEEEGLWFDQERLNKDFVRPLREDGRSYDGLESMIYATKDNSKRIKVYSLQNYDCDKLSDAIASVARKNYLFPSDEHEVIGFGTDEDDSPAIILAQNTVIGETLNDKYIYPLARSQRKSAIDYVDGLIDDFAKYLGFELTERGYVSGDFIVTDLTGSNIMEDANGKLHVVDCFVDRKSDSDKFEPLISDETLVDTRNAKRIDSESKIEVDSIGKRNKKNNLGDYYADAEEILVDTRNTRSKELDERYPGWSEGSVKENGGDNTQVTNTVGTYKKVGQWAIDNGLKNAHILDASSGLGLGTLALREMGLNVDDVEPYPASTRKEQPTFSSYDAIDKQYDLVISNAVLNVIPDDWREGVMSGMAAAVKPGGKMFINTRSKPEAHNTKNKIELEDPYELLVLNQDGSYKHYQKFSDVPELISWAQIQLGPGWKVEKATAKNIGFSNACSIICTKEGGPKKNNLGDYYADAEEVLVDTRNSKTKDTGITLSTDPDVRIVGKEYGHIREKFNELVNKRGHIQSEIWRKNGKSVETAQKLIEEELGRKLRPSEDAYHYFTHMQSINEVEVQKFCDLYWEPLMREIARLAKEEGVKIPILDDYTLSKSGLERNEVFAVRDANNNLESAFEDDKIALTDKMNGYMTNLAALQVKPSPTPSEKAWITRYPVLIANLRSYIGTDAHKKDVYDKLYNHFRQKDYSGLTALFGVDKVADAEAEAKAFVEGLEKDHDFTELWRCINYATNFALYKTNDCGTLKPEVFDMLDGRMQYYVPMRGWREDTAEDMFSYGNLSSKGMSMGRPNPLGGKAHGRRSVAERPFEVIAAMGESAVTQGNFNILMQHVLNLATNSNTDLFTVSEVYARLDPVTGEYEAVFPDIEEDMTPQEIAMHTVTWVEQHKNLVITDPDNWAVITKSSKFPVRIKKSDLKAHQMIAYRAGKPYMITVNGNPRFAMALKGELEHSKNRGVVAEISSRITRNYSSLLTTYSPAFALNNLSRDFLSSRLVNFKNHGAGYTASFAWNWWKNLFRMHSLYSKYENGKLDMSNPTHKLFKQFIENGGQTGYANLLGTKGRRKELEKVYFDATGEFLPEAKDPSRAKKFDRWIERGFIRTGAFFRKCDFLGVVDAMKMIKAMMFDLNKCIENNTRFSTFKTSMQRGSTVMDAIEEAKNITGQYNQHGAGNALKNEAAAGMFEHASMLLSHILFNGTAFTNAKIQSWATIFADNESKGQWARLSASCIMMGAAAMLWHLFANMLFGDDDDYANIPEYEKQNKLCIPIGKGQYIGIPLAYTYKSFWQLGDIVAEMLWDDTDKTDSDYMKELVGSASGGAPINFEEGDQGGTIRTTAYNISPTLIRPIISYYTHTKWNGEPIYQDKGFNLENKPEYEKVFKTTDRDLVDFSKWMYESTKDDKLGSKGKIDINPAVAEFFLESYLGGPMKEIMRDKRFVSEMVREDGEFKPRNIPFFGNFSREIDKSRGGRREKNFFYESKNNAEAIKEELKSKSPEQKKIYLSSDEYKWYKRWSQYKKKYDELTSRYKKTGKEEYNERADELVIEMNKMTRDMLGK